MDKHMIHIDDLVRQRLGGGLEPERPGAWLNMKELLDKEMPVAVASGSNRRRIIGYFTGLLLLATASVGGYQYLHSNTGHSLSGGGGADEAERSVIAISMPSNSRPSGNAASSSPGFASDNSSATAGSSNSSYATHSSFNNNSQRTSSGNSSAQLTASGAPNLVAGQNSNKAANRNNRGNGALAVPSADNVGTQDNRAGLEASSGSFAQQPSGTPELTASVTPGTMADPGRPGHRSLSQVSSEQVDFRLLPVSASISTASQAPRHLPAPAPVKYRYETIETIEIVYRRVYDASIQKTVFRLDTVPKGKVVVARPILPTEIARNEAPARNEKGGVANRQKSTKSESSSPAIVSSKSVASEAPAAILPASKPASQPAAEPAASKEAVAQKQGKSFALWNAEKVNEAINKFKFNLARIQMYPGVMGGINASLFTPNSLGGFQVGLTSLFVLNDWWSLMTELKYIHRFNTGSSIRDDYMVVVPGSGSVNFVTVNNEPYKAYQWQDQTMEHSFNYDVVQTLEMPLALRYSWGRIYAQGGLNLVYSKTINATEVNNLKGDIKTHRELRPATHIDEPFLTSNNAPLVKLSDFGSRFGTGYVLGAGLMFSPSVYMDFRLAQTFWDNAKTDGAKQISKDLLRTPSIQFSVGYRFGQQRQ